MGRLYKTLVEVKLMHEYFLTSSEGKVPFAVNDQLQRIGFLEDAFSKGRESIDRDISFELFSPGSAYIKNLKLLRSYGGFRLVVTVKEKRLSDNTVVYEPEIPVPADLDIIVLIYQKNGAVDSYSGSRLLRSIPATYFFSNDHPATNSTFPYLTNNIPSYDFMRTYEIGELASFASNVTRFFCPTHSSEDWLAIEGNSFANEADRVLVPLKFQYSFMGVSGIQSADFNLKNKNGELIKTIHTEDSNGIQNVLLDFSDKAQLLSFDGSQSIRNMIHSLDVSANGFSRSYPVIFNSTITGPGLWAAVHLRTQTNNNDFRMIAEDGFLFKRIDPSGNKVEHRVFEIPVKSRLAYWRYRNQREKKLQLTNQLSKHLERINDEPWLLSIRPKSISQSDFNFRKQGEPEMYLPNPLDYELKTDPRLDRLFFFDIVVPGSELFPLEPPP